MEANLFVSSSPHLRDKESIKKIMFSVVIALVPALILVRLLVAFPPVVVMDGLEAVQQVLITMAALMLRLLQLTNRYN